MASSSHHSRSEVKQDYIARIRYSNKVPPPPNPPKLLNIPGTGLGDGHFLEGSYGARLVREQPLNIEVDSELGMPINLVGLPGIFDGDERCIQGLDEPPIPHPNDKPLLKPLSALGKAAASASGVSFLRRTEYMTSNQGPRGDSNAKNDALKQKPEPRKRKHDDISTDDPARIIEAIEASFALANGDVQVNGDAATNNSKDAWTNPKHPTKPHLKLLDSYPILPDLDATPDTGSYTMTKFNTNPVATTKKYDERLDVAILRPRDPRPEVMQMWRTQQAEREASGDKTVEQIPYDYDLFLPEDEDVVNQIKRDVHDADEEGEAQSFEFPRIRTYETNMQQGNLEDPFDDTVALALYDDDDDEEEEEEEADETNSHKRRRLAKGAYFYPVGSRTVIRPARSGWRQTDDTAVVDLLDVSYRAANETEIEQRREYSTRYEAQTVESAA